MNEQEGSSSKAIFDVNTLAAEIQRISQTGDRWTVEELKNLVGNDVCAFGCLPVIENESILPTLMRFLLENIESSSDPSQVKLIIDFLCELFEKVEETKKLVAELQGVPLLVGILSRLKLDETSPTLIDSTIMALTRLSFDHLQNAEAICTADGVRILIEIMKNSNDMDNILNSSILLGSLVKIYPPCRTTVMKWDGVVVFLSIWKQRIKCRELIVILSSIFNFMMTDISGTDSDSVQNRVSRLCKDCFCEHNGYEMLLSSFVSIDDVILQAMTLSIVDSVAPVDKSVLTMFQTYPNILEKILWILSRQDLAVHMLSIAASTLGYFIIHEEVQAKEVRTRVSNVHGITTLVAIIEKYHASTAKEVRTDRMLMQILGAVAYFSHDFPDNQNEFRMAGGIPILINLIKPNIQDRIAHPTLLLISRLVRKNKVNAESFVQLGAMPFLVNKLLMAINSGATNDPMLDSVRVELCDTLAKLCESHLQNQELFARMAIPKLIQFLTTTTETYNKGSYSLAVLHGMLEHNCSRVLSMFASTGGLQALLQHLRVLLDIEPIHIPTLVCILNLFKALLCDGSVDKQDIVTKAGGMTVFVTMLGKFADQFESLASPYWILMIDVISFAAKNNFNSRVAFGDAGGVSAIVRLLRENFNISGDEPFRNNLINPEEEAATLLNFLSLLIIMITRCKVSQDALYTSGGVQFIIDLFLHAPQRYRKIELCSYSRNDGPLDWWSPLRRMMVMVLPNLALDHPQNQRLLCNSEIIPVVKHLAELYVVNPKHRQQFGMSQQDVMDNAMVLGTFLHGLVWPHFMFAQDALFQTGFFSLLMQWLSEMEFADKEYILINAEYLTTLNVCLERHAASQEFFLEQGGLSILSRWLEQDYAYLSTTQHLDKPSVEMNYAEARYNVLLSLLHLISDDGSTKENDTNTTNVAYVNSSSSSRSSSGGSRKASTTSSSSSSSSRGSNGCTSSSSSKENRQVFESEESPPPLPVVDNSLLYAQHKEILRTSGILAQLIRLFGNVIVQEDEEDTMLTLVKTLYHVILDNDTNFKIVRASKVPSIAQSLMKNKRLPAEVKQWVVRLKALVI